ncbi:MAG: hypothetical protein ING08_14985 [Roseomonas sp.]|nr:hypothetical protein [Roseomonas sp.]
MEPSHSFGRIHRDDIAAAALAAMRNPPPLGCSELSWWMRNSPPDANTRKNIALKKQSLSVPTK